MALRVLYKWDFGEHEHAFAVTVVVRQTGHSAEPEAAGGRAYNYDT